VVGDRATVARATRLAQQMGFPPVVAGFDVGPGSEESSGAQPHLRPMSRAALRRFSACSNNAQGEVRCGWLLSAAGELNRTVTWICLPASGAVIVASTSMASGGQEGGLNANGVDVARLRGDLQAAERHSVG